MTRSRPRLICSGLLAASLALATTPALAGITTSPNTPNLAPGGVVIWQDGQKRNPADPAQMTDEEFDAIVSAHAAEIDRGNAANKAKQAQLQQKLNDIKFLKSVRDAIQEARPGGTALVDNGVDPAVSADDLAALVGLLQAAMDSSETSSDGFRSAQLLPIYANYVIVAGQNGSSVALVPSNEIQTPSSVMTSLDLEPALCGH